MKALNVKKMSESFKSEENEWKSWARAKCAR
jgi:hypothetical protein